jgi:hypothetical protein
MVEIVLVDVHSVSVSAAELSVCGLGRNRKISSTVATNFNLILYSGTNQNNYYIIHELLKMTNNCTFL